MSDSDSDVTIVEDCSIEGNAPLTELSIYHEGSSREPTAMEDLPYTRALENMGHNKCSSALLNGLKLTHVVANRHTNHICGLSNRVNEPEKKQHMHFESVEK